MIKSKYQFISLFILFFLAGCAGIGPTLKGPVCKPLDVLPKDKAIIYIYRTEKIEAHKGINFSIKANGEDITTMKSDGYYQYYATPGMLNLSSLVNFKFLLVGLLDVVMAPKKKLDINVEANKVYYVRCNMSYEIGSYVLYMMSVEAERGEYEIRGAKLLPDNKSNNTAAKAAN